MTPTVRTSTAAAAGVARCAASCTRTSAGCSTTSSAERGERFAPDLLADPVVAFVDRTFLFWSLLGLAIPFGLGYLIGGTVTAGLDALLWGGVVRVFLLHHVTYSINSLCHFFGYRSYETGDHSHNLAWLAPLSMGEAWHNNHHAFPTSAFHGLERHEVDLSGLVILAMERTGLAWDVQRIAPERRAAKAIRAWRTRRAAEVGAFVVWSSPRSRPSI